MCVLTLIGLKTRVRISRKRSSSMLAKCGFFLHSEVFSTWRLGLSLTLIFFLCVKLVKGIPTTNNLVTFHENPQNPRRGFVCLFSCIVRFSLLDSETSLRHFHINGLTEMSFSKSSHCLSTELKKEREKCLNVDIDEKILCSLPLRAQKPDFFLTIQLLVLTRSWLHIKMERGVHSG